MLGDLGSNARCFEWDLAKAAPSKRWRQMGSTACKRCAHTTRCQVRMDLEGCVTTRDTRDETAPLGLGIKQWQSTHLDPEGLNV